MSLGESVRPAGADRRPAALPLPLPLIGFLVVAACTALPILAHLYLPLVDLPNHIARRHVAATGGTGALAAYYTYTEALVPNSAVDLFWRWLGHPGDPARFSQLALAGYAVNLVAATMLLSRVIWGRWSLWPAAAGLFVLNGNFYWGFENYLVTLPFAIAALAAWIGTERRHTGIRLALFLPLAAALYLMHFFAFAALAIAAFGREVQRLAGAGPDWKRQLGRGLLMALPFLLPLVWMVLNTLSANSPAGSRTEFGNPWMRLDVLVSAVSPSGPSFGTMAMTSGDILGVGGLALVAICALTLLRRSGPRLRIEPRMVGPVVAVAAVALVAPTWLNGVALVHIRLPVVAILLFLAATRWQGLDRRAAGWIALVVAALIAGRGLMFEREAARNDAEIRDMLTVLEVLPEGARLLPLRAPGGVYNMRLAHAQAYAVVARDAFVPTMFQGVHAIRVREPWTASAHPAMYAVDIRILADRNLSYRQGEMSFLQDWERKFTHALLLDPDPGGAAADPRLHQIARTGRFTLYRIDAEN